MNQTGDNDTFMNPKHPPPPPPPALTPADIYYILFRHKWLVITLLSVSLVTAVAVMLFWKLPFESEAKLLIKYVKESKPPEEGGNDTQVVSPDMRGANIINTEIDILTSMDLAANVVDIVTPAKILKKAGGGTNATDAAVLIRTGLKPEEPKMSDVITLVFTHPDADMVQPILKQIIESYLAKHNEVHSPHYGDYLSQEIDTHRGKLNEAETQLQQAKAKANIFDLESTKRQLEDEMARNLQETYEAQAEYAASGAAVKELRKLVPSSALIVTTNSATNTTVSDVTSVPPDVLADYRRICEQLSSLETRGQTLLDTYTPASSFVQKNNALIATAENQKTKLENQYKGLTSMKPIESKGSTSTTMTVLDPVNQLNNEILQENRLAAKIGQLTNEMILIRSNASLVTSQEGNIFQLEQAVTNEASQLAFYLRKEDESRALDALQGVPNITVVESPTPPARDTLKPKKVAAGIFLFGFALAVGIPFMIELYLDRTLKRPKDIQARLGLPFFITIPQLQMNGNGAHAALNAAKDIPLLAAPNGDTSDATQESTEAETPREVVPANGEFVVKDEGSDIHVFFDTLRDRLTTFFEMINLTHKPKLVAVTSCGEGAGVTTTAANLASSLSETGDGNVLLVDMNVRQAAAHHFYKGRLACGLDRVLEKQTRDGALVQDNLYVAREAEGDAKLPRILPKRFSHLLPKMKASDFDYIIFDMPPVSQISITPRLSRFMDMVLLVIESGKTDRDCAKRTADLLAESKTPVGIVLNKSRSYLPRRLRHDI